MGLFEMIFELMNGVLSSAFLEESIPSSSQATITTLPSITDTMTSMVQYRIEVLC